MKKKSSYLRFGFLLFLLSVVGYKGYSQPGIWWQKYLGGSKADMALSVQPTADAGYIVAGRSASGDGDVVGHHGTDDYWDAWVVKLNESGSIQWKKTLGGSYSDVAQSVIQTSDGGYVFVGHSFSNDGDVIGHYGSTSQSDVWAVKLDANGSILWQRILGGTKPDAATCVIQASDGSYVLAAQSYSEDGDVSGHQTTISLDDYSDFWVVKLNETNGATIWEKSFSYSSYNDKAHSISQTADGGYIVAGITDMNDWDGWVIKLNPNGNVLGHRKLGGSDQDYIYSVQQTIDGGYILAGYSYSSDGDVIEHSGFANYADGWVMKLSPTLATEWSRSYGGTGQEAIYSIQQVTDGGYVMAGYAYNEYDADGWVAKLDATGDYIWNTTIAGYNGYQFLYTIRQTSDGNFVVTGSTNSLGVHGTPPPGFLPLEDMWVLKLGPTAGISESPNPRITTFPNPTPDKFAITAPENHFPLLMDIYGPTGSLLRSEKITDNNQQVDISGLPGGCYYIRLKQGNMYVFENIIVKL